ncbi:hypothetical protein M1N00_03030, partial [Thermodesulfovibrionales bacterium]|nr:hypothetical protein [Thermodesulfovibrionales bacterium]
QVSLIFLSSINTTYPLETLKRLFLRLASTNDVPVPQCGSKSNFDFFPCLSISLLATWGIIIAG